MVARRMLKETGHDSSINHMMIIINQFFDIKYLESIKNNENYFRL